MARDRPEASAEARAAALEREVLRLGSELQEFTAAVSHDLKAPARNIGSYCGFIRADFHDRLDDAGRERLVKLEALAARLSEMIDALLRLSRLGQAELALAPVDLGERVREVWRTLRQERPEPAARLVIRDELPTLSCDGEMIDTLLRALLCNALQYHDGPEVGVEVGLAGERTLYVRDDGIGIREQHRDAVFQVFRRLHARDRYGGGLGTGLTLARKIVLRHGGRIWVESEVGSGTSVLFELPEALVPPEAEEKE